MRKKYRWDKKKQSLVEMPTAEPGPTLDQYLRPKLGKEDTGGGDFKYKNERERIKHLAHQVWDQKNMTSADIKASARSAHHFPKSASEYAAMLNFNGRVIDRK